MLPPSVLIEKLRKSRYFASQPEEQLRKLLHLAQFRQIEAGQVLLQQGARNQDVHVLLRGSVTVKVDGKTIYRLNRSGDIFGEMSVITGEACSATILANEPLDLISFSAAQLQGIHSDHSHELHYLFYHWFALMLSQKLNLTSQKAKFYEDMHNERVRDMEEAKKLQQEVFTSNLSQVPSLKLSLKSQFADVLGGDLYGIFTLDHGLYGLLVGDVSGHGTAASLIALSVYNFFHHFARSLSSPAILLSYINNACCASITHNRFVTAFYGIYHPLQRRLYYTNAGHHPGLLIRQGHVSLIPQTAGMPMGIFDSFIANYEQGVLHLEAGDRILIFTDAVFECYPDPKGEEERLQPLMDFIQEKTHLPSQDLVEAIYEHGRSFIEGGQYLDDFTLMIFDQV